MITRHKKKIVTLVAIAFTIGLVATGPVSARAKKTTKKSTASTTKATTPTTKVMETPPPSTGVATTPMLLTSSAFKEGGSLPVEYTCDGASTSPPLQWTSGPTGTLSYAVIMHHIPPSGDAHWYWVLYNMGSAINRVDSGTTPPANIGTNSVNNRTEYAPPCSKGPGPKEYIFTVYALSKNLTLSDPTKVDREALLAAMQGVTLSSATLHVTYERTSTTKDTKDTK